MEDINHNYSKIRIGIASPEVIRSWSYGELQKPETINYRTLRPEKDGLFCERIFGTTKDWECFCGRFKSMRFKGVVCNVCNVEVTNSKVRRERMGHIELACPVVHIWFYAAVPSRIGLLLDLSIIALKSIIYYEKYIVTDPGDVPDIKRLDLLKEKEYYEFRENFGQRFKAGIGADVIQEMLQELDIENEANILRRKIAGSRAFDRRRIVRLSLLEDFHNSLNRPEWMVLNVIPVIPPELRPMVQLDSGRFATSDLNDLYRRTINRNNRLNKLIALKAPDIIVKNEKRMLQESVDALFDNTRRRRVVRGVGNRPLKSLSDTLKGKQGRFRQNLLGKRVDYSARSVIVVGPELKLNECGIPRKIAIELFKPFIMRRLMKKKIVYNMKSAKRLIESESSEVWAVLDEVVSGRLVLLNRAPTLHRLGIQAFEPVLTNEKAIRLHPLICVAYNADFDGDQMAVHLPLSPEAQIEAWLLMFAPFNIFNPANGELIVTPTQDIVLGIYGLTLLRKKVKGEGMLFHSREDVMKALGAERVDIQAEIFIKDEALAKETSFDRADKPAKRFIPTSPGRILLSSVFPEDFPLINQVVDDAALALLIKSVYKRNGHYRTFLLFDKIKELGFHYSTIFANTISLEDIIIPDKKYSIVKQTEGEVSKNNKSYQDGVISEEERYQKNISLWTSANDEITQIMMEGLKKNQDGHNSLYIMAVSGAKGSKQQIRQLAGMRGLMARPSGEIIDMPIKSNFKEGLHVLEYFISTHGARKGLSDTALKTADAGYLTRKLVDTSQDMVIIEDDCGTIAGIEIYPIKSGGEIIEKLSDRVVGRFTADEILNPYNGDIILQADEIISEQMAIQIDEYDLEKVKIRTVVTCETANGLCRKCYGINLATDRYVDIGEVIGIIASQSIGQPGTQLTMRTFHIGGTASSEIRDPNFSVPLDSVILDLPENLVRDSEGKLIAPRRSYLTLAGIIETFETSLLTEIRIENAQRVNLDTVIGLDKKGLERKPTKLGYVYFSKDKKQIFHVASPYQSIVEVGASFEKEEFEFIKKNDVIYSFDTIKEPIIAELSGVVKYSDVYLGRTLREDVDEITGISVKRIIAPKEESLHPKLIIVPKEGEPITTEIPLGCTIQVEEGEEVMQGTVVSSRIRSVQQRTTDITGGLPRVEEIFEARIPSVSAILAEIDGVVELGPVKKGKRIVFVNNAETGLVVRHVVLAGNALLVRTGDAVRVGDAMSEGSINPHDILRIRGEVELYRFVLNNIQEVYKRQGVNINDKHIGVIVRQMLRKMEVIDPGDSPYIRGNLVDKYKLLAMNKSVLKEGGQPAVVRNILLGLTKASLNTESFISSASFQETTKVLTKAAIKNSYDYLQGLKENVIIGKMIPGGTGREEYKDIVVYKEIPGDLEHIGESESNFD